MRRKQSTTKMILEAIETDTFHLLKDAYAKKSEIEKRDFGEHLFDCFKNKWIAKVWEFDVDFALPTWAERKGKYKYIIILTTNGQTWLDYIREMEKAEEIKSMSIFGEDLQLRDIEDIQTIYDTFELTQNYG